MYHYPITVHHENDHYWSSCFDLPEAHSAGDTLDELLHNAPHGIALALSIHVDQGRAIPQASRPHPGQVVIHLPAQVVAKAALWNALCQRGLRVADLARRLNLSHPVARRLVDFEHNSKLEQVEAALAALGQRLEMRVEAIPKVDLDAVAGALA